MKHLDLSNEENRERLTRLFRYAQVGRCVSSVTHDINNFLGVIQAYMELVELDPGLGDESRRMLTEALGSVKKCATMLGSLTSVARKERPDRRMVSLPALLDEVVDLKRYDYRVSQVTLDTQWESGLPDMAIDIPKFSMAIIHLMMNALEAVEGESKRLVRITARRQDDCVEIAFWNSGPAVYADEVDLLFEPFRTTKGGEHVGLGLFVAREAARLHRGDIVYNPERGFVLSVPLDTGLSL